jgi:hypothetical protein
MYDMAQRLQNNPDKEIHIIYLGDHDPSGIDMTRDVKERLELFSYTDVYVHRVALNMAQIEEYNPPENPAKMTDSRADAYIAQYGESSWELDALEPRVLAQIVRDEVMSLVDEDLLEVAKKQQRTWREELAAMSQKYLDDKRQ